MTLIAKGASGVSLPATYESSAAATDAEWEPHPDDLRLDVLLREETGLPVFLAEDPLSAVVIGAGKALEELDILRQVTAHA